MTSWRDQPVVPVDREGSTEPEGDRVNRCSAPRLASTPIFGAGTLVQNGYLTPVSRLMMIACPTSRATAASRTTRYAGLLTTPSDTINVVAAAGGCGTFSRIISAPVMARESAVAMILAQPSSVTMAGPACSNPVTQSAAYPQAIPIA